MLLLLLAALSSFSFRSVLSAPYASRSISSYPEELSFLILGDWGASNSQSPEKMAVADAMRKVVAQTVPRPSFIVSVGDNFYTNPEFPYEGLASSRDPKFNAVWKDAYSGLSTELPWLVTAGNHDWYGDVKAELSLSRVDSNWFFPSLFWTSEMFIQAKGQNRMRVSFIFVDTNLLFYGYAGDPRPEKARMAHNFHRFGWTEKNETVQRQLRWIELQLAKQQKSDYLFVVGHHPLATCAEDQQHMKKLRALLAQYRPTAYMFGHAHSLQYQFSEGTMFLQSGAGSFSEPVCSNTTTGWGKGNIFGFLRAHVTPKHFLVEYLDGNGTSLFNARTKPRIPAKI